MDKGKEIASSKNDKTVVAPVKLPTPRVASGGGGGRVGGAISRGGARTAAAAGGGSTRASSGAPEIIGKYKIKGEIARGGMGVVYKAHHPVLDRDIVIKKMLSRGSKEDRERFTREAKILYDMQSPYIVKFLDTFDDARYRYIVEEFVDGVALDRLLDKQTKLPPEVALLILRDVCYALAFAHERKVIHRDIKPGNVLISKMAEIKLTDFGIGRVESEKEEGVTQSGAVLGTPAYMPPEQFDDSSSVDQRADIYALGVMLYVMVTGQKPYPGNLSAATLELIRRGKYTPPQKIDPSLPNEVSTLIKKMMKSNASARYKSVVPVLNVCTKYLAHYDTHDIKVEIARAVFNALSASKGPYKFKTFVPKDERLKKIGIIALSCAAAAAAGVYLWQAGYIHRYLLRQLYTPVDVRMLLPTSRLQETDLPIKAFFYSDLERNGDKLHNGQDGFPKVDSRDLRLSAVRGGNVPSGEMKECTYSIKSAFLHHGNYRIKVAAGPYIWWKSFEVGSDAVLLECDFLKNARRPLSVNPHAYDAQTGEDITKRCRFTVLQDKKWKSLEAAVKNQTLISGQVWRIKTSCNGYNDEIFSLLLDWYQDELYISSSMTRIK